MMERYAHLVGSLPGASAYEAMSTAMKILGGRLHSLPDGETGERRNWSWPAFQQIRGEYDQPALAYQSGVPGDLDLAMFTFGIHLCQGDMNNRAFGTMKGRHAPGRPEQRCRTRVAGQPTAGRHPRAVRGGGPAGNH